MVVVYPEEREVLLYRASGIEQLTDSGVLRFDDILPGFAVPVASIFDGI